VNITELLSFNGESFVYQMRGRQLAIITISNHH